MKLGFFGLLQIVFITLKLTDYIDWSWGLVLLPFWIWLGLFALIGILVAWLNEKDPLWRHRK